MDRNNVEVRPKESMMTRAIRSAGDNGPEFAEAAIKYEISPDEPAFALVQIAVDVRTAVQTASGMVGRIEAAAGGVQEAVYKGTLQAGADLKGTVEQAGRNVLAAAQEAAAEVERKVGDAISRSAKAGGDELRKAVASLGTEGSKKRDELVREMQTAAARAAADQARASLASKLVRSWLTVAVSLLLAGALGGAAVYAETDATGRITPSTLNIYPDPNGYMEVIGPGIRARQVTLGCPAYRLCLKVTTAH